MRIGVQEASNQRTLYMARRLDWLANLDDISGSGVVSLMAPARLSCAQQ